MANTASTPEAHMSLYERVLADPESRDAFFNTTQAQLFGDVDSPDVQAIEGMLVENSVAYLVSDDKYLARPVLYLEHGHFVGREQISRAIGMFLVAAVSAA